MTRKEKVLILLRTAGKRGRTNTELSKIALRYGGLLGELYKEGYGINTVAIGKGLFRYILVSEPETPVVRKNALEVLLEQVEELGEVDRDLLVYLMDELNISVKFKSNTYKKELL